MDMIYRWPLFLDGYDTSIACVCMDIIYPWHVCLQGYYISMVIALYGCDIYMARVVVWA